MPQHVLCIERICSSSQTINRFSEIRHEPACVLQKVHIRLVSHVKIRRSHIVIRFAEIGVDLLYVFKKVYAVHAFLQHG